MGHRSFSLPNKLWTEQSNGLVAHPGTSGALIILFTFSPCTSTKNTFKYSTEERQTTHLIQLLFSENDRAEKLFWGNNSNGRPTVNEVIERLGGTLKDHLVPTPSHRQACQLLEPAAHSPSVALSTSRDAGPAALWAAVPQPHHPPSNKSPLF